MATQLNPYLNFRSEARAALDRYREIFGGELSRSTYGEFHASEDPAELDKVMHSQLTTAAGFVLMASDIPASMEADYAGNGSISISGEDETEIRGYWDGLLDGGTVVLPLEKAPWGDSFGQVRDRFGVMWLVNITAPAA